MSFQTLGLMPELLRAVREQGYEHPTPIQIQAIPLVLEGRDLMGRAQTGTGKTAGFTLPLLQLLAPHASTSASPARHPIRALILTPTRELAMQVEESVRTYGKHLPLRSTTIFGGVNINPQTKALRAGVEILVATPGRLLDHQGQGNLNFSQLEILVLDEADRMLDMGFIRDIQKILALLPNKSQPQRIKALEDFKKGAVRVLVATDIAARGLDIDQLPHVVNYELPHVAEDYIHRIGRTGRAGSEGEALSLVCVDEQSLLRDIEKLLRKDLPKDVVHGYAPDPSIPAEPIQTGRQGGGGRGRGPARAPRAGSSSVPHGERGRHPSRPGARGK